MPSALVTGITGQDGTYLAELLLSKGYDVVGLVRGEGNRPTSEFVSALPEVRLIPGDLTNPTSLAEALDLAQPNEVYNLGAISSVSQSWENARSTSEVTAVGVLNILDATLRWSRSVGADVRFYQASSSEMFGRVNVSLQNEQTMLWPRSPYAVAKAFGHHMTINYRESYGMHASSGILFNHESPRRGVEFVTRKITSSVARIHRGLQHEIVMGDLSARRDWGFAGDYVEAMWLMLQQDEPDDYVIATGQTHSVQEFLKLAFSIVGIDDWQRYVRTSEEFIRPAEVDPLVGDASKAAAVLGWKPQVSFEQLVAMMLEADLARVGAER